MYVKFGKIAECCARNVNSTFEDSFEELVGKVDKTVYCSKDVQS